MTRPLLEGIRVLDLGRFIAAPYAAQMLADLGADVVRVERTRPEPDRLRGPWLEGHSLYFVTLNRGKRSVAFDMFSEDGRRLLDELIGSADILVQNYSPRTAADLGFTKERLLAVNPRLIVLAITGYGPDGPDAERVAFDGLAQARSGVMRFNGTSEPNLNHLPYVDFGTALIGGFGLMAALYERERTGLGQFIDASLFETVSSLIAAYGIVAEAELLGTARERQGNALIYALGDRIESSDGEYVLFNVIGNMFGRLCEMIGRSDLVEDARYASDEARFVHRDALVPLVAGWARERSAAEILEAAERHRLPFERVASVADLAADAHAVARGLFPRVAQPGIGDVPVGRLGVTLSAHPHEAPRPAPAIGEHTEAVLREWLGWDAPRIEALRAQGVLA